MQQHELCGLCEGVGFVINSAGLKCKCDYCNGTGIIIRRVQTNEEWLHSLNTEQLAEWIADTINDVVYEMSIDAWAGDVDRDNYWQRKSEWIEWLKEKHGQCKN